MQSFFVSSTFKDMQVERDALHRTVMPRLREQAAKNGDNIQFVDLRWGISTADLDNKDSTSKILSVCLQEVQNCKPYMIVLLGERYGWIPPADQIREAGSLVNFSLEDPDISVTELEIRFGMYLAKDQLDRCIFCLREPMDASRLTEEQKALYLPTNDDDARRMAALREKIKHSPGAKVITYRLENIDGKLTGCEEFSEKLYSALEDLLAPTWKRRKNFPWERRQREEDGITAENHLRNFAERKQTLQQITDTIRYTQIVMLEGEGGCGKSAIMAKLNQMYQKSKFKSEVIFCGTSTGCMTVQQLMRLMIWIIDEVNGKLHNDVEDQQLQDHFQDKLKNYNGPTLLFFIDAIDQLAPDQDLFESRFLPPEMSNSIRMIISTTGAVRINPTALTGFGFKKILLAPPTDDELATILHSRFASEHKQISQKVAQKILKNPCCKNMLGMEVMVRRLLMLGQKDFDEINRLEQTMGGAEAIDTYLLQLIEKFSTDLDALIIDYFFDVGRFLDEVDYAHTTMLLYLIGIMQHGISPQELEDLSELIATDPVYSTIPGDHPWRHFWDPISFARLKRFMGGLLVERSTGCIDLSHRLLRKALRSSSTFATIAPVVRHWLISLPSHNDQKLENILPISRLAEEHNRRTYTEDGYPQQGDLINYYFSDPICETGRLEATDDPEGVRQLALLERSIIQDITDEDQNDVAASYCQILSFLIKNHASADHFVVWFFGSKIAVTLANLGQNEKACSLRLLSCILSNLHQQKEAFEAGEMQFRDNWTTTRKRRFLLYHCRLLHMMSDLIMDFRLGNIEVNYFDGLTPETVFQKGCTLADECIREDPQYGMFYLRKAALYAAYAKFTASNGGFGFTKSKQQNYTQKAFQCIEQAFRIKVTNFYREYALYIMAICVESVGMEGRGRLLGAKNIVNFGLDICQKTWDLVSADSDLLEIPIECIARFKLAWSRCLEAYSELLSCKDISEYRQKSLDLCAESYLELRNQRDRILTQKDRKYLGRLGVHACMLTLYGYHASVFNDAGYSRIKALNYISNFESGYYRAEARRDFESRWCWAIMLCAEAYSMNLKPQPGLETVNRALDLLKDLRILVDKKGYAVDVNISSIDNVIRIATRLQGKYEQALKES